MSIALLAVLCSAPVGWVQSAGAPGLDGRLRTLAVDPSVPDHVFAGSKEGKLLFTHDGGGTWQERPLSPFVEDPRRSLGPTLRALGPSIEPGPGPVRRIALCPQARFPLLVLTPSALFGSRDGGVSFVRLFGVFENEELRTVHCAAACSETIVVAGERGLAISRDGGVHFDQGLTPPGRKADVAEVGCREGGEPIVWVAQSKRLYRLALGARSPDFKARFPGPATPGALPAPGAAIHDIEVDGEEVWLATEKGLAHSTDSGLHWAALPNDLGRFVRQVVTRPTESGRELAVVLDLSAEARTPAASLDAIALLSTDDGAHWSPLYAGLSQRRVRWLAAAGPDWWLATSGGVYTSRIRTSEAPLLQAWSRQRLASTPPLEAWIGAALRSTRLGASELVGLGAREQSRCWWPRLAVQAWQRERKTTGTVDLAPAPVLTTERTGRHPDLGLMARLEWDVECWFAGPARAAAPRARLQTLRDQIVFAVQDAWHERMIALQRLVQGASGVEAWTLRARAETLEATLHALAGTTQP